MDDRALQEHQSLQAVVLDWCDAALRTPGLEPEGWERIKRTRTAAAVRICTAKASDAERLAEGSRLARSELAWLQGG